ncbi:MAG: hypothetical protein KF726_23635 [Anaerolineae bacterium]|nr:hypothetical protein [Anaerolineae bacterium]
MGRKLATGLALLMLANALIACQGERAVPTVASIDALSTEVFLTEQAPQPAFQRVAFERVDKGLDSLPAWHAAVTLNFEGKFTGSETDASGTITADLYSNELSGEKRVILHVEGSAFAEPEASTVEGVRIGNSYYLVNQNKICTSSNSAGSDHPTELTAGALIGGVKDAQFKYNVQQLNGRRVWEYEFTPGNVVPPPVTLRDGGTITIASGTLWVAPEVAAVAKYEITYNITNASVQGSQPLTGQLRALYELKETGTLFNIAIPFGC